jgi:hypothetical protein
MSAGGFKGKKYINSRLLVRGAMPVRGRFCCKNHWLPLSSRIKMSVQSLGEVSGYRVESSFAAPSPA